MSADRCAGCTALQLTVGVLDEIFLLVLKGLKLNFPVVFADPPSHCSVLVSGGAELLLCCPTAGFLIIMKLKHLGASSPSQDV